MPICEEKDKEWLNQYMVDKSNSRIYFRIEEISTNDFIGTIQLYDIDWISRLATWGFIIGKKSNRGKGYSVEASNLLFDYAFNILNLRKIFSYPLCFNEASLKMHKKIGNFKEEGCLRKHIFYNEKYHDVYILSLFKEDFNKTNKIELIKLDLSLT